MFEKGNKLSKGRPKGSKNKTTIEIRDYFTEFVGNRIEDLDQAFDDLEAKEKFKFLLDMAKFVVPTLRSVGSTIDELSDEQFERIVRQIKSEHNI
ncbi:hypothetical protein [Kaistella polysaccharea]|uniref:hypothetical protein n=1 Tax=Kaistella polysaccharea TaxID=2878534 RepID=UPI001CF0E6C8|nr:hypothetical protein [Kaistella polysaccharea]